VVVLVVLVVKDLVEFVAVTSSSQNIGDITKKYQRRGNKCFNCGRTFDFMENIIERNKTNNTLKGLEAKAQSVYLYKF
jgi:Fe2+ or Zn2+ uptake regulation protein